MRVLRLRGLCSVSKSAPVSSRAPMICSTRLSFCCHLLCFLSTFSYFLPYFLLFFLIILPFFSRELPTQLLKTCYFGTPNPCELTARIDARALEFIFPPDHYYKNDYKRLKPRISLLASGMNPGDGFFWGKISSYCKAHAKFQGWETSRNSLSCGLQ